MKKFLLFITLLVTIMTSCEEKYGSHITKSNEEIVKRDHSKNDFRYINQNNGKHLFAIIPKSVRTHDTLFISGNWISTVSKGGKVFYKMQHQRGVSYFDTEKYDSIIMWKNDRTEN